MEEALGKRARGLRGGGKTHKERWGLGVPREGRGLRGENGVQQKGVN